MIAFSSLLPDTIFPNNQLFRCLMILSISSTVCIASTLIIDFLYKFVILPPVVKKKTKNS